MSKEHINNIIENMEDVFRGDSWHGPSIMETLKGIPAEAVDVQKNFASQTIAQHVFHIAAFKEYLIQKLEGNNRYEIESDDDNWGTPQDVSSMNWPNLLEYLRSKHNRIIELLEQQTDELLQRQVPGCDYNFYRLLNGSLQHDTYHLGMIWVLWE